MQICRLTVGLLRFGLSSEREVLITDGVGTVPTERGAWSGGVRRRMASASTGPSRLAHPPHRHGRRAVARASAQPPARASPPPLDVVSTTLIVDDLVFHDGTTRMAVLGGGGPQTLFGAGLARRSPPLTLGLVAGIGGDGDCPRECVEWLVDHGVDVRAARADAPHADASSVADHRARRQTHAGVAPGRATQR